MHTRDALLGAEGDEVLLGAVFHQRLAEAAGFHSAVRPLNHHGALGLHKSIRGQQLLELISLKTEVLRQTGKRHFAEHPQHAHAGFFHLGGECGRKS